MNQVISPAPRLATSPTIVSGRTGRERSRHVLFACYDFSVGGHCTHTLNFGRALRRLGHRVGVLLPEPFGILARDFQDSLDYVEVVRRGVEGRTAFIRRLVRKITALNPDVLINNAVPSVQATLPFLPARLCRISVVHNYVRQEVALGLANGRWVDWVVAVSENVGEMVESENSGRVKLATIPVGIEIPDRERNQPQAVRPLRLIFFGRLEPQKNMPGLLRVLSHLQASGIDYSMTVAGGGRELESTRALAAASSFSGKIQFLGFQSQREIARLLEDHDFLLMTSHYEGTPHAVLEAMAHGLVAVVSRLPGATDRIITHGQDGFLCDRDAPEEYSAVLGRFTAQPGAFAAISRSARATAASRYGAAALAKQYEALFQPETGNSRPVPEQLKGEIQISPALKPNFPTFIPQCKHRLADLHRQIFKRRKPAL